MNPSSEAALAVDPVALLAPITERVYLGHRAIALPGKPAAWTDKPLTKANLAKHVDPSSGIKFGCCPIPPGTNTTRLALLDLDSHKGETAWPQMVETARRIATTAVVDFGVDLVPFRSSGGSGLHLIALWDEPQDAYSVRALLIDILAACGFKNGTAGVATGQIEVFPKQHSVPADGFGNMFVLPFAGKSVGLDASTFEPIDATAVAWTVSDPVAVRERPTPARPVVGEQLGEGAIGSMLESLPVDDHDRDQYLAILQGVHHATGGSEEGFQLFQACYSSRWEKWGEKAAADDRKNWDSTRLDRDGAMVTIGTVMKLAREAGWQEDVSDRFEILPDFTAEEEKEQSDLRERNAKALTKQAIEKAKGESSKVIARHATTDLKNAERLQRQFGAGLTFMRGRWHSWSGTHWAPVDDDAFRKACNLSAVIHAEAQALLDKVSSTATDEERKASENVASALRKWAHTSESVGRIEAAVRMLQRFSTVDKEPDEDPWLLNARNGTIDLRTGEIRPHARGDLITRLIDVDFDPKARSPMFEQFLHDIMPDEATVQFLQRWFGYCATGDISEQKFAVHWGTGGNGKSTLIEAIESVLGPYASRGSEDLMTGTGEVKGYAIAALAGGRMVTASETAEGAPLRESTIKNVTGDALLTGRFLYRDPFTFRPTHKLQLLTNHKPTIKGQDRGMWRRVLLVPYRASYGSQEEVGEGKAQKTGDPGLPAKLATERAGILAWLVAGAIDWQAKRLRAPASVLAAVGDYQEEQDRVGHFLAERCELGADYSVPLLASSGFDEGLYPTYVGWAKSCGYLPVNRQRFEQLVEGRVQGYRKSTRKVTTLGGKRQTVTLVHGLRLQDEEIGG